MLTSDFNFELPPELIAQQPTPQRDQSRLLVLNRETGTISHRQFPDVLEYLRSGDVLVLNNSRVIPARLRGQNSKSGGNFEVLLLTEKSVNNWWAMIKPGKRAQLGTEIKILDLQRSPTAIIATVAEINAEGHRRLIFRGVENILSALDALGEIPLPPYIEREVQKQEDRERYQTVYAESAGSVAAPTAGLHLTPEILEKIKARGVKICFVTLHVGLGTFSPVKAETLAEHVMHEERFFVPESTAEIIQAAKNNNQRVIAVGTTSMRVLESVAKENNGHIIAGSGTTSIFIFPPYQFKIVDAMVTNFHLPCSTLLMLISAFAAPEKLEGKDAVMRAYEEAICEKYRFFSYGDAMLIS